VTPWYALFTKWRYEYQVDRILSGKGLETYVPSIRVRQRGKTVRRPFFPRYMFVQVDLDEVGLSEIQWTPGLTRIVSLAGLPTQVPESIIDRLKQRLTEYEREGTFVSPFSQGDRVRIKSGPLRDFDAVFDQHLSSAERVWILVNVLGNLRRTEIDVDAIAPLE
jgi:transcriptional antiterminator RfaH